ncbi:MAG TPA: SRPBCC family protein [Micromonosporaceae bacterium]
MNTPTTLPAVRRSVTVKVGIERAFAAFTEHFGAWWPANHHINPNGYADSFIEPYVGGRWFERAPDGSECDWGQVLDWSPPTRVRLSWHLNGAFAYDPDPDRASEVEVTFTAESASVTRVELIHRHFERAVDGSQVAAGVSSEGGWGGILSRYAALVEGRELAQRLG